jgi:hypothetical protein
MANEEHKHTEYLTSPKLKQRLYWNYLKYGIPGEFDDFLSEYQLRILEGKSGNQTLDQFTVDHIRSVLGRAGQKCGLEAPKELNENSLEGELDLAGIHYREVLEKLSGMDRAIFILSYKYGFDQREIAEVFAVNESRISQMMPKLMQELLIGMNS